MTLYPFLIGSGGFNSVVATGGTISTVTIGGKLWQRHTFSSIGGNTFTITSTGSLGYVDVIMWGAGGGGSNNYNGANATGGNGAHGIIIFSFVY